MSDFYLPPEHLQALLQEYLDASQSVRDIEAYQRPPETVHRESVVQNPRASRAAVYGPNWANPSTLSPTANSVQPQKDLVEELMRQSIKRDSAAAALQLRSPETTLRMPPPRMPPPQGVPTSAGGVGATAARAVSPVLLLVDLLTRSGDLNKGEDQATGRASAVAETTRRESTRDKTAAPTNNPELLQFIMRALTPVH